MILRVTAGGMGVDEADDCTRLHVRTDLARDALAEALRRAGNGRLDDDGAASSRSTACTVEPARSPGSPSGMAAGDR